MKQILIVCLIALAQASLIIDVAESIQNYRTWKQLYSIRYNTLAEDVYRMMVYHNNVKQIQRHNADLTQSYKTGINQYTTLTKTQWAALYTNNLINSEHDKDISILNTSYQVSEEIDWVAKGAVNSVRSQGPCGASYAYSATGAIQGQYFLNKQTLPMLSWQQILDCTTDYGNFGCSGGLMSNVFKYAKDKGLTTESAYPYKGVYQKCLISGGDYKISGFSEFARGDCKAISAALLKGPIAAAIDASQLYNYHSGIFNKCSSSATAGSGALIVGQNETSWKVQMNFGVTWGVEGYVYLPPGNSCAICDYGSLPVL